VANERELAAVVAHGLLNVLTVLADSAATLRAYGQRLGDEDHAEILDTMEDHAVLFADGLSILLQACSDAFGDAATRIALAGRGIRHVEPEDLIDVLDGIVEGAKTLRTGLEAQVRGLPKDIVRALDGLASNGNRNGNGTGNGNGNATTDTGTGNGAGRPD
jgi:hypothetical protein